jgi:uncharacterized NAD(P)/FAD-binding protein YdhS
VDSGEAGVAEATVVVGGGPAGALTATALLRHTTRDVVVIDPGSRLGSGAAYATREDGLVLNSRAEAMSAESDDPGHFVAWCRRRGLGVGPHDFPPRHTYGDYLEATVEAAAGQNQGRLHHVRALATHVVPLDHGSGWAVTLGDGSQLSAGEVVLALGQAPPVYPVGAVAMVRANPNFVADPWRPRALDAIPATAHVLVLGTGLTAIDVIVSLSERGHTGKIMALSRHGLLPMSHLPTRTASTASARPDVGRTEGLRQLLREVRTATRATDWRDVVDELRPRANEIWSRLSVADQDRFLRHVLRYWEIHRHRVAPGAAEAVQRLRAQGTLTVHKGHIASLVTSGHGFSVRVTESNSRTTQWTPDVVVNCTGPGHPAGVPLVRALVAAGVARADPLHLGVDVDPVGRLVRPNGQPTSGLFVVGALRRGRWWETTAIPEIRSQAILLARAITAVPRTWATPAHR